MNMKTTIIMLLLTIKAFSNAQTSGTLTVSTLTSQTTGATYAPANIVAMWIVDSNGTFVKSMLVYAVARQQYLYTWIASDAALNKVDAVTGATQTSHGTRNASWNGKNINEAVVPDGSYSVKMELTDKHAQGNLGTFTFLKGPNIQILSPADIPSFANISIKWTPVPTAVENVTYSNLFAVYPNPSTSTIYVDGIGINEIEICSITGKNILTTNLQKIDLSPLPKGVYLAIIKASNGTVVKKIEKE